MAHTHYPGVVNSPVAYLTGNFTVGDTVIAVDHLEVAYFPAAPNIAVMGDGDNAVTYLYTGKSGSSGAGNLTGVSVLEGTAKNWTTGTPIGRNMTNYDLHALQEDIVSVGATVDGHTTLIAARATRTTAALYLYVDAAATGTGDGLSWTNACTTIAAAVALVPDILLHAVTITVRKGASAYSSTTTIKTKNLGSGSLTIQGEYYWNGECATATGGASSTKFDITSATGGSIAVGDPVMVRDGYAAFFYGTVASVTARGSNVYTVEISSAASFGNIGSGDYYLICKTKISVSGATAINVSADDISTIRGLHIESLSNQAIGISSAKLFTVTHCFLTGPTGVLIFGAGGGQIVLYNCYIESTGAAAADRAIGTTTPPGIAVVIGSSTADNGCAISTASGAKGVLCGGAGNRISITRCCISATGSTAIDITQNCVAAVTTCTIPAGTTTGLKVSKGAQIIKSSVTNNATTPESGSVADSPYIGT